MENNPLFTESRDFQQQKRNGYVRKSLLVHTSRYSMEMTDISWREDKKVILF